MIPTTRLTVMVCGVIECRYAALGISLRLLRRPQASLSCVNCSLESISVFAVKDMEDSSGSVAKEVLSNEAVPIICEEGIPS